jgi:hypothetical protein
MFVVLLFVLHKAREKTTHNSPPHRGTSQEGGGSKLAHAGIPPPHFHIDRRVRVSRFL